MAIDGMPRMTECSPVKSHFPETRVSKLFQIFIMLSEASARAGLINKQFLAVRSRRKFWNSGLGTHEGRGFKFPTLDSV